MMEKDNKGFTLIEMIVVIAIMAVLVGMGVQMFGLTETGYIKRSSADLKSLIDQAEYNTQALAAKEWKIEITKDGNSYVARLIKVDTESTTEGTESTESAKLVETVTDEITLSGGKKLRISFDTVLGGGEKITKEISDTNPLTITFEKQSGEVNKVTIGTDEYSSSALNTTGVAGSTDIGSGNITIDTNSSGVHGKTICIYWSTGKILMK
jgi:prepilin-type N-terminal cleavage/methylation domain-containing protein